VLTPRCVRHHTATTPLHSNALKTTDIWSNTIGIDSEGGTNAVIEASIYAPGGGGRGRAAKQQRAQELIASCE
jgi:hypothetical protein